MNRLILIFFTFLLFSIDCNGQKVQRSSDLKDFKITIEKTDSGIKMYSSKGSAWINLSFNLLIYKPHTIDEYGMTEIDSVSPNKDLNLSDYLFTIIKTKDGIKLTGLEGTAWTELSFSLAKNGKQTIDQFGMSE